MTLLEKSCMSFFFPFTRLAYKLLTSLPSLSHPFSSMSMLKVSSSNNDSLVRTTTDYNLIDYLLKTNALFHLEAGHFFFTFI